MKNEEDNYYSKKDSFTPIIIKDSKFDTFEPCKNEKKSSTEAPKQIDKISSFETFHNRYDDENLKSNMNEENKQSSIQFFNKSFLYNNPSDKSKNGSFENPNKS